MFITAAVLKSSPSIHTGDLNCKHSSTPDNLSSWHHGSHFALRSTKLLAECEHKHITVPIRPKYWARNQWIYLVHCAWNRNVALKQFTWLKRLHEIKQETGAVSLPAPINIQYVWLEPHDMLHETHISMKNPHFLMLQFSGLNLEEMPKWSCGIFPQNLSRLYANVFFYSRDYDEPRVPLT